ncbi:MAG TPA: hypothetical protein VEP90_03620 [Methylomirabilota bacterium]|nr:hypothetical protein [Methylomirabilota bacterium]
MEDKFDDNENPDYSHRFGESETRRMIERAYLSEEVKAQATHIVLKALGDLPIVCDQCGGLCDDHCVKLRDAFFKRARNLADKLYIGLDIYLQEREFGVIEPVETINTIYRLWSELSCLHELVEPQMREDEESIDPEEVLPDED